MLREMYLVREGRGRRRERKEEGVLREMYLVREGRGRRRERKEEGVLREMYLVRVTSISPL